MRDLSHLDEFRTPYMGWMGDKKAGAFLLNLEGSNLKFTVLATYEGDWDHVSVSTTERCPRWNEMQQIKTLFFNPQETVIQIHPPESEYVNNHPYCLHLWRPQKDKDKIPLPPSYMVGIKSIGELPLKSN